MSVLSMMSASCESQLTSSPITMDVGLGDELSKKLEALEPLVQGHMFKQTSLRRSFVKRYFVLFEGVLLYYSHERDYKTDRRHGLKKCKVVKVEGLYLTMPTSRLSVIKTHQHNYFKLHCPDPSNTRTEFLLVTPDRKSKHIWIEMLQSQNPNLLPATRENTDAKPAYIGWLRLQYGRSRSLSHGNSRTRSGRPEEELSLSFSSQAPIVIPTLKRSQSF